MASRINIYS